MKYFLVSKVCFPLYANLCTFGKSGQRESLAIGAYEKSRAMSEEELESREIKRLLATGSLVLRQEPEPQPQPQPQPSELPVSQG